VLIPGTFEVNAVLLEVSWETAVVAYSFVISVCIAVVCIVFSMLSLSACFSGMIVYFAVCAVVLLMSVSLSAMITISATGV
jgi:hypothetical protein